MKKLIPQEDWPDTWKYSYPYDLEEIYGQISNRGYAYAFANRRKMTMDFVQEVVPVGGKVLDVAAAQGNFSLTLAELGYEVTWNDLREELVGYVQLKHEHGNIRFAPGNVFDLDLENTFDCVLATEIIEHVAHPDEFLRQLARLVKPGGYVVLTTPNGAFFRNPLPKFSDCKDPSRFESIQFKPNSDGHIFLMWPDELKSLGTSAGLKVDRIQHFTTPLTNGYFKTSAILKVAPRSLVDGVEQLARMLPSFIVKKLMIHSIVRYQRPIA